MIFVGRAGKTAPVENPQAAMTRVLVAATGGQQQVPAVVPPAAIALRDAGYEVIDAGSGHTAEGVARAAVDEDVDVVGLCAAEDPADADAIEATLRSLGLVVPVVVLRCNATAEQTVAAVGSAVDRRR